MNSPKNSALLRDLIPVFAEKHQAYQQLRDFLAKQDQNQKKSAIDQDNGIIRLTRSLFLLACLTRGEYDDYVEVSACQDEGFDHLTFRTFKSLARYFELFEVKPDLYRLLELYIIVTHISGSAMVNGFVRQIPKDQLNYGKFGMAFALVENGLIPEVEKLDLAQFDILRNAFKYAAKVEQNFAAGKKITFNREFSDSEQRIVYASVVCELAAFIGPIGVSGSLTLTESLAADLALMMYHRNNPEYIGFLCGLSQ